MVFVNSVSAPTREQFGKYELISELASGGMATVFLARRRDVKSVGLDRFVALKRIHPHLSRVSDFVEMFLDEARITSRINHPNVCTIHDFGESDGQYFIAMEYVFGETFAEVQSALKATPSKRDALWPMRVARMIADAAEGLHAAHAAKSEEGNPLNIVHRDVSPQNLFLAYDGSVRVMDFGIAHAEGRYHHTRTGTVKGKFAYMSPEQYRAIDIDRRADVWALGVVAWELLTGKRLFRRPSDAMTMKMVETLEVPPPSTVDETVPEGLDAIILGTLERDLAQRTPSCRELSRALNRWLATTGEPMGMPEMAEWCDRELELHMETRRSMLRSESGVTLGPPTLVTPSHSALKTKKAEQTIALDDRDLADMATIARAPEEIEPKRVDATPMVRQAETETQSFDKRWVIAPIVLLALGFFAARTMFSDPQMESSPLPPLSQPSTERTETGTASSTTSPDSESVRSPMAASSEMTAGVSMEVAETVETTETPSTASEPTMMETATKLPARMTPARMTPLATPMVPRTTREPQTVQVGCAGCWANLYDGSGRRLGVAPTRLTLTPGTHRIVAKLWEGRPNAQVQRVRVRVPSRGPVLIRPRGN